MIDYVIITDSGCDLTKAQLSALDVSCVELQVNIPGSNVHLVKDSDEEMRALYAQLRSGTAISTSAVNVGEMRERMEEYLKQGKDVLYLGFDSMLSSTYQNCALAAQELQEEYPERRIVAVDTLCASLGLGLLVTLTARKRLEGCTFEQTLQYAQQTAKNMCHWFTVDDLHFLKRGGRVSAAVAIVGSLLSIKPVMHKDTEGRLTPFSKTRGRKKALDAVFEKMREGIVDPQSQEVMICHGDCLDEALQLKERMLRELGVKAVTIGFTGPVIGAHSGPGTMGIFYIGNNV